MIGTRFYNDIGDISMSNLILSTDSYKQSMAAQYPPNTTSVYSYVEARGGKYDETVFLGMQAFLREYLSKPITIEDIDEANNVIDVHMGEGIFNREGWMYILEEHNGYLPLRIKAVPEGTVVKTSNVLVTVENTDPKCWWLTTFVETIILRGVWYPTTVGSKSREIKKMLRKFAIQTGNTDDLDFALHDFGARGVSSKESASIGGAAHLVNFRGSDTLEAITHIVKYYDPSEMAAYSVPASEHSTITSWGRDNETAAYKNMFDKFGGKYPIVSVVSDSYDVFNAAENIWGDELKEMVVDSGSTLVIRPDSGEPAEVVGKIAQILDNQFGSTINDKGFKVLNNVRILQGDGLSELIDFDKILMRLVRLGFSTNNIVFGMGGGLLQNVSRDTYSFAMKASSIVVDGDSRNFSKDPITDTGKRSKTGRLSLVGDGDGGHRTVSEAQAGIDNVMQTVYHNGQLFNQTTFDQVRDRAAL